MSAPVLSRRCWGERTVNTTDRIPGDGTQWPLPAMTLAQIHKWQKVIVNLRFYGEIINSLDPLGFDVVFDFKLSDVAGFVAPTELTRLSTPGLAAHIPVGMDGTVDGSDTTAFIINMAIGQLYFLPDDTIPVLLDGSSQYLPFYLRVEELIEASVDQTTNDLSTTPSEIAYAFDGNPFVVYADATTTSFTGSVTIEVPTGAGDGAFLSWGGLRDPDTGHFLVTSL